MLRFFDPLVHYSNLGDFEAIGGVNVASSGVDFPSTGGFQGGSHLRFIAGQAAQVDWASTGSDPESSLGAISNAELYSSFKIKIDGPTSFFLARMRSALADVLRLLVTPNMGLEVINSLGATVARVSNVFRQGEWHHVMLKIDQDDPGEFRFIVDGRTVITLTDDFEPAVGVIDQYLMGDSEGAPDYDVHVDEMLVWDAAFPSDGFTGIQSFHNMHTQVPDSTDAAPATVSGAATAHEANDDPLNASADGDTTHTQLDSTDVQRLGFPALPADIGFVRALGIMAELNEGDGPEPDSVALYVESNGARDAGFDLKPGLDAVSGYEMFRHYAAVDPDGGGTWSDAKASAAQAEIETVTSLASSNVFGAARGAPGQPELQRSTDGTNWVSNNLVPYPNQIPRNGGRNVGTGTLILAGDNGLVLRSTDDGQSWVNQNAGGAAGIPLTFDMNACWYGNGRWIVGGSEPGVGGQIYYSNDDGANWLGPIDPDGGTGTGPTGLAPAGFSDAFYDGVWCPDLSIHVGVGYRGAIWTSPDGLTWTERTAAGAYIGSFYGFRGIEWSPSQGLFVVTGDPDECQTSPDGINWTQRTLATSPAITTPWGVCYSPTLDLWLIHGNGTSNLPNIQTSPDGINWTNRSLPAPNNHAIYSGGWDAVNNLFILTGRFGRAHNSVDGINWTYTPPDDTVSPFVGDTGASIFAFIAAGEDK